MTADSENMKRILSLKEKEISLLKKEVNGLKEDNDRIHRMYVLMQKEAFPAKQTTTVVEHHVKPAHYTGQFQGTMATTAGTALRANHRPTNAWQGGVGEDNAFGSSRDISNITHANPGGAMSAIDIQIDRDTFKQ